MPLEHNNVLNAVIPPQQHCIECGFNTVGINRHFTYEKIAVLTDAALVRGKVSRLPGRW